MQTLPPVWPVQHCFSVDLEDYFQVNAFESIVDRSRWDTMPSRVEQSTGRLLELLARHRVSATFFALGWIAERFPGLIRAIVGAGHEIASHGYWHRRVTTLTPEEFRSDLRQSKAVLEAVSGASVRGFRAPSFSIVPGREWAFDILLEEGFSYDSSLFPIRRPGYGYPNAPAAPFHLPRPGGDLLELPLATTRLAGFRIPAAGGGYLRQLPFALIRRAFREWSAAGISAMFYVHPWEVDPEQPRLPVGPLTRLRHYRGLARTLPLLERLLTEFRFTSVSHRFDTPPRRGPATATSERR